MRISLQAASITFAAVGIVVVCAIAGWLTADGRRSPTVEQPSVDSWATADLPPIDSSDLAKSLLLLLVERYDGSSDAAGIAELSISAEIGLFCLLPPEDRDRIHASRTMKLSPEGISHLNGLIRRCGLILLRIYRKSKRPLYLAYYAAGEHARAAEINVRHKNSELLVIITAYTADDAELKLAVINKARSYVTK